MSSDPHYLKTPISRLFPDDSPEGISTVNEAAAALRSLEGSQGYAVLLKIVDAERHEIERGLQGRVKEHTEYARAYGQLDGLATVRTALEAFAAHAESCNERAARYELSGATPG